jgi:hypothetical protein
VDTIKALKEIRDITMNRLTLIHKEIYDIADAAIREASAEGCTASPPKTVRDWPAGDLPPCPPYQNGLSYSPPKEERRELGKDEIIQKGDILRTKSGDPGGEWETSGYIGETVKWALNFDKHIKCFYRPAPAQGEKKHEEGYTGMRVELVNHGGEDKFEIVLQKGGGIWVLSVEKAEQLANWILELLDV